MLPRFFAIATLLLTCLNLKATIYTPANGAQLQANLASAVNGDTILLSHGVTYNVAQGVPDPNVAYQINASITLCSGSGASCTAGTNAILSQPNTYIALRISVSNVIVSGITVNGGSFGIVEQLTGGSGTLSNIVLQGLTVTAGQSNGQGISLGTPSPFTAITNSVIERCVVSSVFHAIAATNSTWSFFINNTVQQTTVNGDGIVLILSDHNVITGNTINNTNFDGIVLVGSQYNYVGQNNVANPHNGVTLTPSLGPPYRQSIRNYVGNNVMTLNNQSGSDGIWFNDDSNWNMALGNDASGANENGLALFNAVGNYMRANIFHDNPQGGIFVARMPDGISNTVPNRNTIQQNYLFRHGSNGGVITNQATSTDVGFNFIAGDPANLATPIAGFLSQGNSNSTIYGNVVQNLSQGENLPGTETGDVLFLNRYFNPVANPMNHYTFSPAVVQWDSGSTVLGGNFFSDFLSANGNPSNGATPYANIIYDVQGHKGLYQDRYPYQSESLGKQYGVTVLSPAAGAFLAAGTRRTISWSSQGCVLVDLTLLDVSNNQTAIVSSYADYGYYFWTVPAVTPGTYRVQVTCKTSSGAGAGASGTSSAFSVTTSDLVLLSPQIDQIVDPTQPLLVSWKKSSNVTQAVDVYYRASDTNAYSLLQSGVTVDFLSATPPATASNRFSVKVVSGSFADSTDSWFTIRTGGNSSGQFTAPSGPLTLAVGTPFPLEWIGPPGSDYVDIDLVNGGTTRNIVTGMADFGKYRVLIPDLQGSNEYFRLTFHNSAGTVLGTAQSALLAVQPGTGFASGPSVVSVSPSSGSGSTQTFAVTVADPGGAATISSISFLVNSGLNGANGCWVLYNRAANTLQLANDAASGFSAPVALGNGTTLSNTQCTVNPGTASASSSGNNVTVNIPITFSFAFGGLKTLFVQGIDTATPGQSSGWQPMGTWTVLSGPAVLSIAPASGSGSAQTFAVTVSDPGGATAITSVSFLLNNGLNGANACWVLFNRAANTLQLANDAATAFSAPITVGTAASAANSQCTVSANGASVSTNGTNLTVNLPLSFAFSFAGVKTSFVIVYDATQNSGWQTPGTWTVPASGPPAVVSTVPGAGSGSFQNFAVTVADGSGPNAITYVSLLLNNGLNGANGCWVLFNRSTNTLQLGNDAGSAFSAPITIGTAASTANSQCTLNVGGASVTTSGTNLTVNLPLSFAFSFAGVKSSFVIVYDATQNSGWRSTGNWTVPASGPPAAVSTVPGAGTGSFRNFAVTAADGSGPNAITYISFLLNNGLNGAGGCWVLFNRSANTLQLGNDAGTGFSAPITIGTAASTANSQCTMNAGGASVTTSGTNLTVNLPLSFAFSFAGAKSSFVIVYDASQNSGWQGTGTWTVPASGTPAVVSTVPGAGAGSFQNFAVTVADGSGPTAITNVSFLINNGLNGAGACWVLFNRSANTLQLANDAATAFSAPITIGTGASTANSQCTMDAGGASVTTSGTNLTVNLPLSFAFSFAGAKSSFLIAYDSTQNSGWQATGSWTVPASGPPAVVSAVPASGSGPSATFSVAAADGAGPSAIANVTFLVNTGINGANACWILYIRSGNTLQLANDAGTAFSAPVTVGTGTTLSNSQCSVNTATASTSATGTTLRLNLPVTFIGSFHGLKNTYVLVNDNASQSSGWQQTGTWTP
ncbi:MAG: hypothetical protein C5B51_24755 [Terriglobia bacterium]|nr:MAG: hypothetical protein C5B51_24755 [Terriglobia bacterium]